MNRKAFSIIVIPDTQTALRHNPHLMEPMARWISDHARELNVKMVLQLGDIVDSGANDEEQFVTAFATMERIAKADLPFLICPGNHDYDNLLGQDRSLTMFNRYFGPHIYRDQEWFGGLFEEGCAASMYVKLEAEGRKLLALALEFGPRDEVLAWADGVLAAHPDYEAIVITHCFMHIRGERTKSGDGLNPKNYAGSLDANDGEDVWQKSLRKHPNVIAVFSGHHVPGNVSYRVDLGDHGNPVFQSFQNWQMTEQGGEGRFRVVTFLPDDGGLELSVLNPQIGSYEEAPGYLVSLPSLGKKPESQEASAEWSAFCYPPITDEEH